jgi:ribonucleoside-diphosphate reductase alpha chain
MTSILLKNFPIIRIWREKYGEKEFPDYFVSAQTLDPIDHVRMQSAAQKWVDSSISKTITCPVDIDFKEFKEVYMEAWNTGCKGCTTYRPNEVTGSVLSISENSENVPELDQGADVVYIGEPLARPESLEGNTYKIKWLKHTVKN